MLSAAERRKITKPCLTLPYDNSLMCFDCRRVALLRYVLILRCHHVVCIFCYPTHCCNVTFCALI